MGRPVGYLERGKHCPYCGAVRAHWKRDPKDAVVDFSAVTYIGDCHYEPEECVEHYDMDGRGYVKPDLHSPGWDCSHCGGTMVGGDGGWFDLETGEPGFEFCPHCGWRVDKGKTMLFASSAREME